VTLSRVLRIVAPVAVVVATLVILLVEQWPHAGHRLTVRAYFSNVDGLREGANVRIAGVDIGSVKSVHVRPELGKEPVEVVMLLNPAYEIRIPSDSLVSLQTAGVLGATYAEINTASASGPPIEANAVLKSQHVEQLSAQQLLDSVSKLLEKRNCDCCAQSENAQQPKPLAKRPASSR
jgi:phospholipid/cholesterol/gamma-HCH transport system substrate-binding protein